MAMVDIRDIPEEKITAIKFSDDDAVINDSNIVIRLRNKNDGGYYFIYKSDIPNLIAALNKAKDLGWY